MDSDNDENIKIAIEVSEKLFLDEEKKIFDKYLKFFKLTAKEYFAIGMGLVYEKNNRIEIDTLKYSISPLTNFTNIDSTGISEEDYKIIHDLFKLSPKIYAIYAEMIRQKGTLNDVLNLYYNYKSNNNKIIERFSDFQDSNLYEIEEINNIIDKRIQETKEQIEYEKSLIPDKPKSTLLWSERRKTDLSKISKRLHNYHLTNKSTDFEKVFLENKPTEWKGSYHILAHLLYCLGNISLENKLIKTSDRSGYMQTALLYFMDCNCNSLLQLDIRLNDFSSKVRRANSEHDEVKEIVSKILKDISIN